MIDNFGDVCIWNTLAFVFVKSLRIEHCFELQACIKLSGDLLLSWYQAGSMDPLVLLWLSHTRADKAVEEFLDAPTGSSAGGSSTGAGYKKARATFPDDFLIEDSVRIGPCSVAKIKKEPAESSRSSSSGLQPIVRKRAALQAASASGVSPNVSVTGLSESSPEVSSSQNGTGISPVSSLASSEIGEVDLDFWDLDIHESSTSHSSGKKSCI